MKYSKLKISAMICSAALLAACASPGKSSGSSEAAGKFENSKFCQGAIDQNGLDQALDIVAGDPVKFACKASYNYSKALAKTYKALGSTKKAEEANRYNELLRNGTAHAKDIRFTVSTELTTEEKEKAKDVLLNNEESKKLYAESVKERQAALQEVLKGSVATYVAVKLVQADLESDNMLVKGRAVKKMVEIAQAVQVLAVIYETEKLMRNNQSEIGAIANVDVELAAVDNPPAPPPM
jgi:hypothetical protein